jgi:uncharacterized lipoprotein NlpE involved in copper resistance
MGHMKKLILIVVAAVMILAGCNLASEKAPTPNAPNPEPPATTVATYPACNSPDIEPAPVLRIDPDRAVLPGCYQFAHGESFTVRWDNPADDVQMIEFFRNCTDTSAPSMMCTDRAVDSTPDDGFSVTFTMPETFNEVVITAIAYGEGQGSAIDSGGIVVFTEG